MCDQSNQIKESKAVTVRPLEVPSGYYDPVVFRKVELGQEIGDNILCVQSYNKFLGYYGLSRWSRMIKSHTGYDYFAPCGTPVYPVHHGYITAIKFGPKDGCCGLLEYYKRTHRLSFTKEEIEGENKKIQEENNNIEKENNIIQEKINEINKKEGVDKNAKKTEILKLNKNKKKKIKEIMYCNSNCWSGCFGLQMFLKDSNTNHFAFYAHLSELDETVFKQISVSEPNFKDNFTLDRNYLKLNDPIEVLNMNQSLGKSGNTGNASSEKERLECREKDVENNDDHGTVRFSPNRIVKTEFKIKYKEYSKIPDRYKEFVQEFKEEIVINDIIEYRASEKWKKAPTSEYLNMIREKEKNNSTQLEDEVFDKRPRKFKWNAWENWFEYKNYLIEKESQKWQQLKTELASKRALDSFGKEHVIVVGNIKGLENNTEEVEIQS